MKIGILTYFETDNYGTFFQAYALQNYLQGLGHEIEFVHIYRNLTDGNNNFADVPRKYSIGQRIVIKINSIMHRRDASKKHLAFDRERKKLNVGNTYYKTTEELKATPPRYDLYMSGGDQIWNPNHKKFSYTYMFDFLPDKAKRVSYASSFATEAIADKALFNQIKIHLQKYSAIGVREESGCKILKEMGIVSKHVVDPVFLVRDYWLSRDLRSKIQGKYCLIYAMADYSEEADSFIKQYAKKNNLKIVIIPENRRNHMNFYKKRFDLSPDEFLSYIANATAIFTNSFHGLAFAIIYNRQFSLLDFVSMGGKDRSCRLTDFLDWVGISDHSTVEDINKKINYDAVNDRIHMLIKESKQYIGGVLHE